MDLQVQDATWRIARLVDPSPPPWVTKLLRDSPRFMLTSTRIADATALSRLALIERVADAYGGLLSELRAGGKHAVRMWNFVPDIHGKLEPGDRYMAFNAGRFAAFGEAFGIADGDHRRVPTASAVGCSGRTLSLHILSAEQRGTPVENPRQIPSYRYSSRYGVRPPCFARATKVDTMLLIGGTASIIGEDSHHASDIDGQIDETLRNVHALVAAATDGLDGSAKERIRNLRVHLTERAHARRVQAAIERTVTEDTDIEFVEADLCRRELLVEIEGVADCS